MNRKKNDFGIVVKQIFYLFLWVVNNKNYLLLAIFLFLFVGFARGTASRDFIVRDTLQKYGLLLTTATINC